MKLDGKELSRRIQRSLARNGMYFFYWLFSLLPYGFMLKMVNVLVAVGFRFTHKQRNLAEESLSIAFGGKKSSEEIDHIVKQCFGNLGRGMVELVYFLSHTGEALGKVEFQGREHLDKALSEGKGVIAVTAHFGNFPLMMLCCSQMKYQTNCIIRPTRDKVLEKFLLQKRFEAGLNTIYALPRHTCVLESLKVLRNNELLFVPLDQNFGSGKGVFVDFFGQKAATATGPIVFASRTQSPILPMFIVRDSEQKHRVIIEPPLQLDLSRSEEENLVVNTQKITTLIESYIRRYPHEWGWMHRRWKSKQG